MRSNPRPAAQRSLQSSCAAAFCASIALTSCQNLAVGEAGAGAPPRIVPIAEDFRGQFCAYVQEGARRLRLTLDTGSPHAVLLLAEPAEALPVEPPEAGGATYVRMPEFGVRALVGSPRPFSDDELDRIDGALGWPEIRQGCWRVRMEAPRSMDVHPSVPEFVKRTWRRYPIEESLGKLAIRTGEGEREVWEIDTGDHGWCGLSRSEWNALTPDSKPLWSTVQAGYFPAANAVAVTYLYFVDGMTVAGLELGKTGIAPNVVDANACRAGLRHFEGQTFWIDGPAGFVYLGPKREGNRVRTDGLSALQAVAAPVRVEDELMTLAVVENGVAWNAGLRNGDVLLEVDGIDGREWKVDPRVREAINRPEVGGDSRDPLRTRRRGRSRGGRGAADSRPVIRVSLRSRSARDRDAAPAHSCRHRRRSVPRRSAAESAHFDILWEMRATFERAMATQRRTAWAASRST